MFVIMPPQSVVLHVKGGVGSEGAPEGGKLPQIGHRSYRALGPKLGKKGTKWGVVGSGKKGETGGERQGGKKRVLTSFGGWGG